MRQQGFFRTNRRFSHLLIAVLLCVTGMLMLIAPAVATTATVYLAESDNPGINQLVRDHFRTRFGDSPSLRPLPESPTDNALIITIGPDALHQVRRSHPEHPRFALFVPSLDFAVPDPLESALYSNPPLIRQARLGRLIIPDAARVSLLTSPELEDGLQPLIDDLDREGLESRLFAVPARDELIRKLGHALNYGDFLLGTTDDRIYNRQTIKHLLLTSYRQNRVLIGPSRAFVRAGAVASTFTPPVDQIREGLLMIEQYLRSGDMPAPRFPNEFSVAVNEQVARSLNIALPDRDTIIEALRRQEVGDE